MDTYTERTIAEMFETWCAYALMAEVSTTPKPGLVDLHDNGAHQDMSYDTFAASTAAIVPFLAEMAVTGYSWHQDRADGLFSALRPTGIKAEQAMFAATKGVNTHKGMIFSMGTVAAVAGWYLRSHQVFRTEDILMLCKDICRSSLEEDFAKIDPAHPKTHGEILFARYGVRGIRGEVSEGFPSIRQIALPVLRDRKASGYDDNAAYLDTLLSLMAHVDDTNVLIRTSPALLEYEKQEARKILAMGGAVSPSGLDALARLNEDFIARNLSPGGCADLLAVTILLYKLEKLLQYGSFPSNQKSEQLPVHPQHIPGKDGFDLAGSKSLARHFIR